MAALSILYDDVMPEVPGCPLAMALHSLRRAAREFCVESTVDRRELAAFNTIAGQARYTLTAPEHTEIKQVNWVKRNGKKLTAILIEDVPDNDGRGEPKRYAVNQSALITLSPVPSGIFSIAADVAVAPSMSTTQISDALMNNWGDAIAMGAKARLMAMPRKPWSDDSQAAKYLDEFEQAKVSARSAAVRGLSDAVLRTAPSLINGR